MSEATKFRKKPIVIEAKRFTGQNGNELLEWFDWYEVGASFNPRNGTLVIETLEGGMTALIGDWIIKGVQDEFYPCKPDIFAATYESVD